jgi:hypothetical protein
MPRLLGRSPRTRFPRVRSGEDLDVLGVANLLAGVDVSHTVVKGMLIDPRADL